MVRCFHKLRGHRIEEGALPDAVVYYLDHSDVADSFTGRDGEERALEEVAEDSLMVHLRPQ